MIELELKIEPCYSTQAATRRADRSIAALGLDNFMMKKRRIGLTMSPG